MNALASAALIAAALGKLFLAKLFSIDCEAVATATVMVCSNTLSPTIVV